MSTVDLIAQSRTSNALSGEKLSRHCIDYIILNVISGTATRNANTFGVINAAAASVLVLATRNNPFPFKILIPSTITLR